MHVNHAQLLVSVRSAAEAEAALAGGADVLDVKDPAAGSLGRAAAAVVDQVVRLAGDRCPVSAALGELAEGVALAELPASVAKLAFLKPGLAGCRLRRDWRQELDELREAVVHLGPELVTVAYADWRQADAPDINDVVDFACMRPGSALLLDTWRKAPGWTLLDWLSRQQLAAIARRCRTHSVRLALAGSLGFEEVLYLQELRPDWFAVRTAVCRHGRHTAVSAARVRRLLRLLQPAPVVRCEG